VVPDDHKKPQPAGEVYSRSYQPWKLEQAKKYLADRGFTFKYERQIGDRTDLYVYQNPHTEQLANLSHTTTDKKHRPIDEAKLVFHLLKQHKPKRRTPDQKYRDNFVLYD